MIDLSRGKAYAGLGLAFFAFFALSYPVLAQNNHLVITEVQTAGTNSSDDFIKIYNSSDSDIFLGNYNGSYLRLVKRTKTSQKDYSIKSWSKDINAKIPAKGYFLWASSKNETFPDSINADVQTSQTLAKNNGIALRLGLENTGEVIDAVGWGDFQNALFETASFNSNPEAGQIIFRKKNGGVFQDTDNNQNDFTLIPEALTENETIQTEKIPVAENVVPASPSETPPIAVKTNQSEEKPKQYPNGIILNEVLPSPEGSDETEEWIEIFNKNSFEVDLSGWKIQDTAGKITSYVFKAGSNIGIRSYLVVKRPESKITLNNDADGLELIRPDGMTADKVSFEKSAQNASYNLTDSGWQWSNILTPGSENIIQDPESDKNQRNTTNGSVFSSEKTRASIGQTLENGNKMPFFLIFIALSLATISAAAILFLKRRILKQT